MTTILAYYILTFFTCDLFCKFHVTSRVFAIIIYIQLDVLPFDRTNEPSCPDDLISHLRRPCHIVDEVRRAIK